MNCKLCNGSCIKKGFQTGRQKYLCKSCHRYQQKVYIYKLCSTHDETAIIKLNNEGVGISSISRITGISKSNVINKIRYLASKIKKNILTEEQQEYEMDEMHTFIKNKKHSCYIIYAVNRATKKVIDFVVGSRTKENINKVITTLSALNPKKIYTDKLNVYPGLITKAMHSTMQYRTNHIERYNLTLRTHLKRLNRKTICFSKDRSILACCLSLYFEHSGK